MKINVIDYIIKSTGLKQKDLAEKLKVSRAQISKWKSGETIPFNRVETLNKLAGLHGKNTDWAILTKTEENSNAWIEYLLILGDYSNNYHLHDDPESHATDILLLLKELGVKIPPKAPSVDIVIQNGYKMTSFDKMILDLMKNYAGLLDWCNHHLFYSIELINNDSDVFDLSAELAKYALNIAIMCIPRVSRKSTGMDSKKLEDFVKKTKKEVTVAIIKLCQAMNKINLSFTTDYFDYINKDPSKFSHDIYMIEAKKENKDFEDSVENYLPFGVSSILKEAKKTNALLLELHIKLDTLLSKENKKKF
jgi:transcriptional regulator with XRE-family HTH domain